MLFETTAAELIVDPGDGQIIDFHRQGLSVSFGDSARQLLSLSDLLPYCGDGDGCRVTLLWFRGLIEVPIGRGEWELFIASDDGL